jgi:epoxyqueuosine reductase
LGEKLEYFASALTAEFGAEARWYVDTGPMMDKALAARSGLGWYGKNTNILTEQFGSWVLLGSCSPT